MRDPEDRLKVRRIGRNRYVLDVRGLTCPYPQLLVTKALSGLSGEDILEVTLDNPPSVRDIPLALEEKGYRIGVSRLDSSTWIMTIQIGQ